MKTRSNSFGLFLAATVLALFLTSCYYMPGQGGGTAKVAIGITPPAKGLKGIPANLSSVALVVTAPGMAPITATAPTTAGSITVSVPAGPARTFTLLLNSPSATLEGVATVDLQAGQTTSINVTPTLGATQIVVPDNMNNRVVQVSDMTGTGWTELAPKGAAGGPIPPYATSFDNLGQLYVAASSSVYRMNDITSSFPATTPFTSSTQGSQIYGMTIDLTRSLLFFIDGTTINRISTTAVAGSTPVSLSLGAIPPSNSIITATGLAVDSADGSIYITSTYPGPQVMKIDPSTFTSPVVLATYKGVLSPWDVLVKGDYVYVSDFAAKKIIRLTKNLQFVDSFPGPTSDPFLGPERFVAILNKPITVIDESTPGQGRLVSFNDIAGAGWTTYGSNGTGTGQFQFYIS